MSDRIQINDQITVGPQPTSEEIGHLPEEGFRSVINLRTRGEDDQPLSPEDEGKEVEGVGLEYRHIPVSPEDMNHGLVDQFRDALTQLPAPVFVHCKSGKRAGAFAMMDLAVKKDLSGEETLEHAEKMGFECEKPELREFVVGYVDAHAPAN